MNPEYEDLEDGGPEEERGLYQKYIVQHADGTPIDPQAIYITLRLDTDAAARHAVILYAILCDNERFGEDLVTLVKEIEYE